MDPKLCEGTERHPHFSLATQTFVEHSHEHDPCVHDFDSLHHHPPVDHHLFQTDELTKDERDTGRTLNAKISA
jgi:hypothetical protein